MNLVDELDEVENLLLEGKLSLAAKKIKNIHKKGNIPYNRLERFGNLANRCGEFSSTMNVLHKSAEEEGESCDGIKKEYAMALLYLGCRRRALQITQELLKNNQKNSYLLEGFCHMRSWDYMDAKNSFENYMNIFEQGSYQYIVGQMNLAFALNGHGDSAQALEVIKEILNSDQAKKNERIRINAQQVLCQVYYGLDDFKKFKKTLNELQSLAVKFTLGEQSSLNRWKIISDFHDENNIKKFKSEMTKLYNFCRDNKQYELSRACHFYLAKYSEDREIYENLYIGTPHESFRNILKEHFPNNIPPQSMEKGETSKGQFVLNIKTGKINDEKALDPGSLPYSVLRVLMSDFYRPFSVYELFESIFPEERFNPLSSFSKVKATVYRLNKEFEKQGLDCSISSRKMNYSFMANDTSILCYQDNSPEVEDKYWAKVIDLFSEGNFKSKEFMGELEISKRKTGDLLNKYLEEDKIEKLGKGSNTKYRIKKSA